MWSMIEFAMDLCALCAVQLGFGSLRPLRLALSEALLAACTLLSALLGPPGPLAQAAVCLICGAVLVDARRLSGAAEAAACLMCAFAAGAGLADLGGRRATLLAPPAMLMLMWVARRRRNVRTRWNVDLYVERDGMSGSFTALIDTGNRLRDRRSGLPVLIVEASAAPKLFEAARRLDPREVRVLPFGVLGSAGELRCFRPDRLEIRGAGVAPDCLVGIYPGRIPGPTRALAPPEFADAAPRAQSLRSRIKLKLRGYRHGIFQRPPIHLWTRRTISKGFALLHRRQRPAPAAADPGGGGRDDAQGERRRRAGPRNNDRAQPPAGRLYRPQI